MDFSWGYRREGGRLLEWLDRFYVSDWAIGRGGESRVVLGITLSGHAPVILVLDFSFSLLNLLVLARSLTPSIPMQRFTAG